MTTLNNREVFEVAVYGNVPVCPQTRKVFPGQVYGYWTVLNEARYVHHNKQWLCKCRCGTERYVYEHNLLNGKSKSCGCNKNENRRTVKGLEGMVFGKLTVLEQAPRQNGRTAWLCQCECGNHKIVKTHDLLSGKTKSCGCQRYIKTIENHGIKDLTGYTTGYLQVLEMTDQRNKRSSVVWKCKCTRCGRELLLTEDELVHGNYKSCGCYRKEINDKIGDTLHFVDNTCVEWLDKRKYRKDNTSGFRGVTKVNDHSYKVSIGFRKQRYYLGCYPSYSEAVAVRKDAEEKLHVAFVKEFQKWNRIADHNPIWASENPFHFTKSKNVVKLLRQ